MEIATFAAGCFWGVEEAFRQVAGVTGTAVGYTGGTTEHPTYEDVCSDGTGHAEAVRVEFDPARVTYEALLEVFWSSHDPTQKNRQGQDVGTQYRSAIFFHTSGQEAAASAARDAVSDAGRFDAEVVTEITAAPTFHRAEEYHQQYLAKRDRRSCQRLV